MFNLQQFPDIVAVALFGGNTMLASVSIVVIVMLIIMTICRNIQIALIVMLPVVFIFNQMSWLNPDLTLLMILVIVIALGGTASKFFR